MPQHSMASKIGLRKKRGATTEFNSETIPDIVKSKQKYPQKGDWRTLVIQS